jgi:2-oxoglutarate ferredoxin oxidoreductase subunit beta
MLKPDDPAFTPDIAWCPGCGNFAIREAVKQALEELHIEPWQVVFVSGIGQAAKLPQYIPCNVFDVLHGRALVTATGVKLANHKLVVIAEAGDGDLYSEGANHLMHAMRKNPNITCLVHNNQVFGLTKGQFSPTSESGFQTPTSPQGSPEPAFNPLAFGVALDAGFVARGFAGDIPRLKELIIAAIQHEGFSLLGILQPCVTFNKVNTFKWYQSRVYNLSDTPGYDPFDKAQAFARSLEWGSKIPCGIIYRNDRASLDRQLPQLRDQPLIDQPVPTDKFRALIERFR